jgi:hypothetical protein
MSMTEDFTQFMQTGDFATAATINGAAAVGIFDGAYSESFNMVSGSKPSILLTASDVAGADIGDPVTIGSTSYTIAGMEPDGTGLVRVMLETV